MRRKVLIYITWAFSLFFGSSSLMASHSNDSSKYLLLDFKLQIEITDAVDHLYNFNFHQAEVEFNWIKYNYPNHPLPYFLLGISTWWQMLPGLDYDTSLDEELLSYMDSTIYMAEKLLEEDKENIEAGFFLAGAYGFKGRLLSERKSWRRATNAGRLALKYLKKIRGNVTFSPEILFGDGLFNYYSIWIRENYPMLRPVLMFFPKGDKALGIEQLKEVATNAFYTRVEAQYFLMRILAFEEKNTAEALRLSKYMYNRYPNNPYFHRFYTRMLYSSGRFNETEKEALDILAKLDSGQMGYEAMSGRYASFYLGHIYRGRRELAAAKKYYLKTLQFGEETASQDAGYYLFASLHLAEIYDKEGDSSKALELIKEIRKNARRKDAVYKRARKLQKQIKRRK